MTIQDMTRQDSDDLLTCTRVARLACVHEGQPYITPINFAYGDNCLYSFSWLGQKIAWMRANPSVCVEVDEFGGEDDWATVAVLGRYEELPDTPENQGHRKRAHELLQRLPMWWEPGCGTTLLHEQEHPTEFAYFRIHINRITGRRSVPDAISDRKFSAERASPAGWLRRVLARSDNQPPYAPLRFGSPSVSSTRDRRRHWRTPSL